MGYIEYMGNQVFYIDDEGLCWESKNKKRQFDIKTKEPVNQESIISSGVDVLKQNAETIKRKAGRPKKINEVI